ncbi:hypothetical protein B7R78_0019330 [Ralstonia solanacearum]|uniref:hypothetical protein n=1 Tax=Ralstonia solanacearum species complex TaxID=3116862 RepID=UPI00113FF1E5|nr:hypothetical protein [Ralstonia solanacearum]MBT1539166.1 hypothetical protein [Ralstonia solanacearum]QOK84608.1 hypothetical protein HF906_21395 [Ralstonia solanacearum]
MLEIEKRTHFCEDFYRVHRAFPAARTQAPSAFGALAEQHTAVEGIVVDVHRRAGPYAVPPLPAGLCRAEVTGSAVCGFVYPTFASEQTLCALPRRP